MKRTLERRGAAVTAVLGVLVVLTGCATPSDPAGGPSAATASSEPPATDRPADAAATEAAPDAPFGTGCGDLPAGTADDLVATAMAGTPAVSALASALGAAYLVDALNSQQDVTVLAPADAAFAAVPPEALQPLVADTPRLTALLTHHVIQGRLAPDELAGTHTTLNNDRVTIEVSPEAFSVPAEGTLLGAAPAVVVCGNLQTANATVYLIDQVLTPPAA